MALTHKQKLALLLVLALGTVGLAFYARKQHTTHRAAILAQSWAIGHELVSRTNSAHLLFPGNLFQRHLAELLRAPAQVEAVRPGDEARPAGQERAASRIYLVNKKGARLALRIAPEGDFNHFRILGWSIPTAPPPPK